MTVTFWVVIAGIAFVGILVWWRVENTEACPICYYPTYKCECKPCCDHVDMHPAIWSQDGWISKCKTCGTIVHRGDDVSPLDVSELKHFLKGLDNGNNVEG